MQGGRSAEFNLRPFQLAGLLGPQAVFSGKSSRDLEAIRQAMMAPPSTAWAGGQAGPPQIAQIGRFTVTKSWR
jgi:hypothetical protein